MDDISTIHSKLIGLNCLDGTESTHVRKLWGQRYHERAAFLVDVAPGSSADDVFEQIRSLIVKQQIHSISGESCILAVFMDLTKPIDPATLTTLTAIPNQLNAMLNCRVSLVYEFAYLGRIASSARGDLRDRIMDLSATNERNPSIRRQICLVAQPLLSGESVNYWKAAIVCLDIMRRRFSPDDVLPPVGTGGANNDVGFLRYGEFDEEKLRRLTDQKARLEKLLSSAGERELRESVAAALRKLELDISEQVTVDPKAQPIHPNMFVEGFFKRKKAASGKNDEFNEAQRYTIEAVLTTGNEIHSRSMDIAKAMVGNSTDFLRQLLDRSGVGIALESDRALMTRCLSADLQRADRPTGLDLRYNENGYTEEIGQYFQEALRHSLYEAKKYLLKCLMDAYNAITADDLSDRASALHRELDEAKHALDQIAQEDDFCRSARDSGKLMETCFTPASVGDGSGGTRRHLLCRNPETASRLEKLYGRPELSVSFINGTAAGLMTLDSAPVKALHILSFDCTPARLLDLIPEVG